MVGKALPFQIKVSLVFKAASGSVPVVTQANFAYDSEHGLP